MIDRINNGDRDALKQLLTRYTKPIYERALARTKDDARAKEITRDTLSSIVAAAEKGECPADTSAWIMSLVDTRCSDDELSAILDDVLSKDPVGWERQEPKKDWQTEAPQASWSGESKIQPAPTQESQPEPEPREEAETRSIQPPAYSEPQAQPEVPQRQPAQEPQKATHERARDVIPEEAPPRARSSRAVPELFDDGEDDEPRGGRRRRSGGVGMVLLILLLLVLVAALVWMLVVMLMTRGILPMADFGFADWFNTNIFKLY